MNLPPVLASASPFFGNIYHGEVEHFEQAVVSRENAFVFGDFSELTVESLDGIGRINQGSDFFGVFEICRQIRPIRPPRNGDFRVFFAPLLLECVESE